MKEKEIKALMTKYNLTYEEAEQLWKEDNELEVNEEIEKMTEKAKQVRRYEKKEVTKKKAPKERKVDENKKYLLDILHKSLQPFVKITNEKTETELSFVYNDENYTVKLIKHRKEK